MHTAGSHLECDRDIYKETIEKWGKASQFWMAVEEMGELQQAMSHYIRGRCDEDAVAEEIADVMLMAEENGIRLWPGEGNLLVRKEKRK